APSIVAASYKSSGIDCKVPVVTIKMYGNPSHPCIIKSAILLHVGSFNHGIGEIFKKSNITLFTAPNESLNSPENTRIVTKPGTAQGNTKIVRNNFLNLTSF